MVRVTGDIQQLIVDKINSFSNFEYFIYESDFMKVLSISELVDQGFKITKKQYSCLVNFLSPMTEEVLEKMSKVSVIE